MRYVKVENAVIKINPSGLTVEVDQMRLVLDYLESTILEKVDSIDDYGDGDWNTDGYQCYYDKQLVTSSLELSAVIDTYNLIKFGVVLRPDKSSDE